MRVLIIVDDFHGGAGNIAQMLAKEFQRSGEQVRLLLTNMHSDRRYDLQSIVVQSVALSSVKGNQIGRLLKLVKCMRAGIFQSDVDIIISFLDNNNTLACFAAWHRPIPIIVCERSNPLAIYPKFPWNHLRRIAYRRADIVTVQFSAFQNFDRGRFAKKCFVMPNLIAADFEKKDAAKDRSIVSFVSVGRLAEIKRFTLMIEFFGLLANELEDVRLYIYGDGVEKQNLERQIRENALQDKVFLMGYTKNVHETLSHHDIYLMTSRQEGFPNALCEAMAVGVPPIAIQCHDGLAELIENGVNGYLIDENERAGFVAAMKKLATDKGQRDLMASRAGNVVEKYSYDNVMKLWKDCIAMACVKRKQRADRR